MKSVMKQVGALKGRGVLKGRAPKAEPQEVSRRVSWEALREGLRAVLRVVRGVWRVVRQVALRVLHGASGVLQVVLRVAGQVSRAVWRVVLRVSVVLRRPVPVSLGVAVLVASAVALAVELTGDEYESRVGLLAVSVERGESVQAGFGEVVALSLPALVELARTPTVLRPTADELGVTTDELARRVSVELVPASGLARLSVRAGDADQAARAATRIAQTVADADLLAPVARLRALDRPETTRVAPDRPLGVGLALVAGVVAGLVAYAAGHLRRTRFRDRTRAALVAGGVRRPVAVLPGDDPGLARKLAVLCAASARPARVVAVVPELGDRAEELAAELPDKTGEPADGDAVIAVVPARGERQDELAAVVGALPPSSTVVAVVMVSC